MDAVEESMKKNCLSSSTHRHLYDQNPNPATSTSSSSTTLYPSKPKLSLFVSSADHQHLNKSKPFDLPIKKRRLRQLQIEEAAPDQGQLQILPLLNNDEEDTSEEGSRTSSEDKSTTLTLTMTLTKHKLPAEASQTKGTSNSTLIPITEVDTVFLNGTRIPNPSSQGLGGGLQEKKKMTASSLSKPQVPPQDEASTSSSSMARIKPKPVYIGDRKGVTFIDIDSQRWWDRAHLAYAFHPKKKKKLRNNKDLKSNSTSTTAVPEEANNNSSSSSSRDLPPPPRSNNNRPSRSSLLKNLYNPEDPRSIEYQEWLCNFYPEKDFSTSTFLHCGGSDGYDEEAEKPKNLLDKLGLVNPLHYISNKEQEDGASSARGRLPPWVTEEGLREFDTAKLDGRLVPNRNRNQKYSYD